VLRTTRSWFRRDLDVLRPLLERMRTEGPDFLQRNAALGEEIRRTLVDLDEIEKEIEKELKRASKSIEAASGMTTKYRIRLQALCDNSGAKKTQYHLRQDRSVIAQAGDSPFLFRRSPCHQNSVFD
jgi:vacuolar-type H+-ATPase subunit D/Vma8